jgi:nucleotidyltransferase substrate binding protein (TIGR01987 family)
MASIKILKDRREATLKALECLQEALVLMRTNSVPASYYKHIRNSAIQCFEFSVDTLWKLLKDYLFLVYKSIPPATPKAVFQAAFEADLITAHEVELLLEIIDARNLTSHTYNESLAEKIVVKLPSYYETMKAIVDRLEV